MNTARANLDDAADLLQILKDKKLTSYGAARLKDTGLLAKIAELANKMSAEDLGYIRQCLALLDDMRAAGWKPINLMTLVDNPASFLNFLAAQRPDNSQVTADSLIEPKPSNTGLLRFHESLLLPAQTEAFDAATFFVTGDCLLFGPDFETSILPIKQLIPWVSSLEITSCDLTQPAQDKKIRAELQQGHTFIDASNFCAHLAGLIKRQLDGCSGSLLINGQANIFYVIGVKNGEVFAVSVRWYAGSRRWGVDAYALAGLQWDAGCRVFSRTAAA